MYSTLIIVSSSLRYDTLFLNYLYKHIYLHDIDFKQTIYLDKSDHNIMFSLEQIIESSHQLLIAADDDSFNFVGKVLSTLSEDSLELKGDTLTPSKAKDFSSGSYLIEYKNKNINTFLSKSGEKLPQLFLRANHSRSFSLIGIDGDTAKLLLDPLVQSCEVKLTTATFIDGWTTLHVKSKDPNNLNSFQTSAQSLFPDKFIPNSDVLAHIVQSLSSEKKSLTVAESCTGGKLAGMITSVSGSSECFAGSVVSYSNEIKKTWLNVSEDTLKTHGAVSELCLREMMEGVLAASGADFAMATSGVAGPNGGSEEKPVGTVFVGARNKSGEVFVERLLLQGSREYIQNQSCYHALRLLLQVGQDIFFTKS